MKSCALGCERLEEERIGDCGQGEECRWRRRKLCRDGKGGFYVGGESESTKTGGRPNFSREGDTLAEAYGIGFFVMEAEGGA